MEIVNIATLALSCLTLAYTIIIILVYEILTHVRRANPEPMPQDIRVYLKQVEKAFKHG